MNNKNKFRFWCNAGKAFVQNYKYNGFVDELFDPRDVILTSQQFVGILDTNMKEIYEGDVVKGIYGLEGLEIIGEVQYSCDKCAYVVDWHYEISNIEFDSLEIVGNIMMDYMYDESGKLVKQLDLS
jgi:uncharacterized phage protein (TIGR01671 family)